MPKHISRVRNARIEAERHARVEAERGFTDEERLLIELNNDAYPTGFRSTRKVVDNRLLALFVKRFQEFSAALMVCRSKSFNLRKIWSDPEVIRVGTAINRMFRRYRMTPTVFPSLNGYAGWSFQWLQIEGEFVRHNTEFLAVMTIKELAEGGRLSSLKQCAKCKRWLFARFSHQRFCSTICKDEFHKVNPKDKERRRKWARENYQNRKELELGSRKATRRNGGKW